jgi:hypothetical protein
MARSNGMPQVDNEVKPHYRKGLLSIPHHPILLLVGSCLVIIIGIRFLEFYPRYIFLPTHAPDFYRIGDIGDWDAITLSTFYFPKVYGRVFIVRNEAAVVDENASRETIVSYFDQQLSGLGWARTESYAPCKLYLPEANFLEGGKEGFIHYYRRNNHSIINIEEGDLVCLAIWKEQTSYNIVLLSSRPSFLWLIGEILSS